MKGGRGYKQWSVNGAPFRGSPYYYSISSACTHFCVAAASSRERDGAREALEGADTSSVTSDSGPGFTAGRTVHCTVQS